MNNKLENFFNKELTPRLKDLLIVKGEDGSYHLFGKYKITQDANGYYIVCDRKQEGQELRFGSLRHAVTYCVFEKNNRKDYNKRVVELDDKIISLEAAIAMHKKLLTSKKPLGDKLIFLTKLEEEKRKKRKLSEEMDVYIETSKRWQHKIYQENSPR